MYFVLIATPRNLGYIFVHNGLTEIGRGMRYLIYLRRQKISPLIWSGHVLSNVSFFMSFILTTVKLTCKAFILELHTWFTVKWSRACKCMTQTLSTAWLYFKSLINILLIFSYSCIYLMRRSWPIQVSTQYTCINC